MTNKQATIQYLVLTPGQEPEVRHGPKPTYDEMYWLCGGAMHVITLYNFGLAVMHASSAWGRVQGGAYEPNQQAVHLLRGTPQEERVEGTAVVFGAADPGDSDFGIRGDLYTHLPDDTLEAMLARIRESDVGQDPAGSGAARALGDE